MGRTISARTTIGVIITAALILLCSSAHAGTVRGKLDSDSPENFKVIAVNRNGSATVSSVAASGKFSIRVRKGTTLQLVDSAGRYRGPLVAARGGRAYPALSGESGNLGIFSLGAGFAAGTYRERNAAYFSLRPRIPFSSSTGPRGANKFGYVEVASNQRVSKRASSRAGDAKLGQDTDSDGLPDLLDIDDDGDLKLDIVDVVPHSESEFQGETTSTLRLDLVDSLNVNSGSISDTLIDSLISEHLILSIGVRNNGSREIESANVDCQSLTYCAASGGTATIRMDSGPLPEDSLWTGFDPDNDGFPNLQIVEDFVPATIRVRPHATREQLRTGDTILMSVTTSDNATVSVPAVIPFIFLTGPALKEFTHNGATTSISYPVAAGGTGTSDMNPFVLSNGSVSLTFWKPQRKNIEGAEDEGYFDMGGLNYGVSLSVESGVYTCLPDEYSGLSSTLSKRSGESLGTAVLRDDSVDSAASPSNTLTYTIDIASCLSRQGVNTSGARVTMALEAVSDAMDSTSQFISFRLP